MLLRMICLNLLLTMFFMGIVDGNIIVQTKNGCIRGKTFRSRRVSAFLSIPYAEPPVGPLRFKKPVDKAPWKDVYNATNLPPPCIQARLPDELFYIPNTDNMSEDCLYLNLWVPQTWNAHELKPILVFFHGGFFMIGATNMDVYDGTTLAEYGNVIVATVNYRLGGLGFFYGNIDNAAGNMGVYDQVAAIQWIKENAYIFGGDPDNIVLMGESAGSWAVSAHLISPLSRNLFRRAILLSGSVLHPQYSDNNNRLLQLSQKYANLIGCSSESATLVNNPKGVIECMKKLPVEAFSKVDKVFLLDVDPFYLRIGDHFLPEKTMDSYRKGHFKRKEILMGIMRNEGAFFHPVFRPIIFGIYGELATNVSFDKISSRQILKNYVKTGYEFIDDKIVQSYINRVKKEEGYTYLRAMVDGAGDLLITCGVIFQADFHSLRNDPVYFYMFDFRPPSTPLAQWMDVTHFEDLPYYFGNPFHSSNFTEYEKRLIRSIMDMWVTFMRTGNPNTNRGVQWPQYSYHNPKYLTIEHKRVDWSPRLNRCEHLRKIYGTVIDEDVIRNLRESEFVQRMGFLHGVLPTKHDPHTFSTGYSRLRHH